MADAYHKTMIPGATSLIADTSTTRGGPSIVIRNMHAAERIWLSGSSTSTVAAFAFPLDAGKSLAVTLGGNEAIYGWSNISTVTTTVAVFRTIYPSAGSIG